MSFGYRPIKNIPYECLLDGRLEKYGIKVDPEHGLLVGSDGVLFVNREGNSTHFEHHGIWPDSIFAALTEEFGTEIANEDGHHYWGFASHAEMITDIHWQASLSTLHWIVVEGPGANDAGFVARWLDAAIETDRLLQKQFSEDPNLRPSIAVLKMDSDVEFSACAMSFIHRWLAFRGVFLLDLLDCEWAEHFCIMVQAGFFTETGERYQITVPKSLDGEQLAGALKRLVATMDAEGDLHPEHIIGSVPMTKATEWQLRLTRMDWRQRVADRDALLQD